MEAQKNCKKMLKVRLVFPRLTRVFTAHFLEVAFVMITAETVQLSAQVNAILKTVKQ